MAKKESSVTCLCGKRGFRDERSADRALGRAQHKRSKQGSATGSQRGMRTENRYYLCDWSDLFHLTSMSRRLHELVAA